MPQALPRRPPDFPPFIRKKRLFSLFITERDWGKVHGKPPPIATPSPTPPEGLSAQCLSFKTPDRPGHILRHGFGTPLLVVEHDHDRLS